MLDLDAVDAAVDAFVSICAPLGVGIAYAAKAFFCIGFARHLLASPLDLDVCSLGELMTAERAGFPPARLVLHGAGKSAAELDAAAAGRVGRIVVDSLDELERYAAISREPSAAILMRCNTGIAARTHSFVRTGGDATKFGLHPRDEERAIEVLQAHPGARFAGLHSHIGSQIHEAAAFVENAGALALAAARFRERGMLVREVIAGGGFGVVTGAGTLRDERAHAIEAMVRSVPGAKLGIEPGRAIVADAGTTIYRVMSVKRQTTRTFVIVDGGLAENPRPALYGATHPVVALDGAGRDEHEVTLCGRSCENDEMGMVRLPVDLRVGELLAMRTTGAYTYSMASNYNRFPKPAVAAHSAGEHRLLIRREEVDDVLRNDVQ